MNATSHHDERFGRRLVHREVRRERRSEHGERDDAPAASVRRQLRPPRAERLEGVPELRLLRSCSSSDASMSGTTSASIVGVKRCSSPSRGSTRSASGKSSSLRKRSVSSPIATISFGCTMCSSRVEHRARLLRLLAGELEAVRPVDGERVDVQPLQRLDDRLPGAAVEGDALLRLRRLRPVLEQEDVRERVARADDREGGVAGGMRDLVAELVDLGDRLLEVPLVDLVGRHRRHGPFRFLPYLTRSFAWAAHLSDWR